MPSLIVSTSRYNLCQKWDRVKKKEEILNVLVQYIQTHQKKMHSRNRSWIIKKEVELTKGKEIEQKSKTTRKGKSKENSNKGKHPLVEKVTRKILNKLNSSSSNETDDAMCLVCIVSNIKSIPGEEWIQCMKCSM